MHARVLGEHEHRVPHHRSTARLGPRLDEHVVVRAVVGVDGRLDRALAPFAEHPRELETGFVVHDVGDHRRAVVVELDARPSGGDLGRPAACARVHRFVQQLAHLGVLGVGGHATRLGVIEAHDPREHRPDAHVRQHVDRLRRAVDAVEELGVGDPVPGHAVFHAADRDGLVAAHGQHRALAVGWLDGREGETAVADHHRRDAVPPGDRAVGVPEQLRVVVRVVVDEAGRDVQPGRVDHPVGLGFPQLADRGDDPVLDADVGAHPGAALSVEHRAVLDQDGELRHCRDLFLPWRRASVSRDPAPRQGATGTVHALMLPPTVHAHWTLSSARSRVAGPVDQAPAATPDSRDERDYRRSYRWPDG